MLCKYLVFTVTWLCAVTVVHGLEFHDCALATLTAFQCMFS